jgi:hypothetical protein
MKRVSIYQNEELDRRRRTLNAAVKRWDALRPSWYLEPLGPIDRPAAPEDFIAAEQEMSAAELAYFEQLHKLQDEAGNGG